MIGSKRLLARLAAVVLVAGAALLSLAARPSSKVDILGRARLGGYAEDLAFVTNGPLAHHLVLVEGYEVWGIPSQVTGKPKIRKLFDLYGLTPVPRPTGIAYVESRKQFVVNDSGPSNFYFVDHQGRPQGGASMVFPLPDGYAPGYIEGLAYVPPTAGQYPDHLVMAAQNANGTTDLLFVDLAGNVVKHVAPACYDEALNPLTGFGSVEYMPGDRLVLTLWGFSALCVVDFDGVAAAPATFVDPTFSFGEGITRLADGRIVATDLPQNLLFFDAALSRLPADDRQDVVGLGLDLARGLAWEPAAGRHLVSYAEPGFSLPTAIGAVPPTLRSTTKVVDLTNWPGSTPGSQLLTTQGLTYVGAEGRIGVAVPGRGSVRPPPGPATLPYFRGILLWDGATGNVVDQVDLCVPSAPVPPATCTTNYGSLQAPNLWGRALRVAYVPGATPADGRFAVRFSVGVSTAHPGFADTWTVYFFDRAGAPAGAIDFSATAGLANVVALEHFDAGDGTGGRLALLARMPGSPTPHFLISDLAGQPIDSFDFRAELGLPTPTEISVITAGPQAGAFAVLDATAQELVVFRVR